jgi:4-hydroxythreonine-4-phosphate dehydrogenase
MSLPVIAITMGDAAGIGPELIVKVLSQGALYDSCRPFVVADPVVMNDICRVVGADLHFRAVGELREACFAPPEVDVLCPEGLAVDRVAWGKLDAALGAAAALCLHRAFEMALTGDVQGVVSAPLNKEAFHLAGYDYLDELAYLADVTGSPGAFIVGVMNDTVWTTSVTEHIPFSEIVDSIVKESVHWRIVQMDRILRRAGYTQPRIGVAALNVHGGEGGLFGREEIDEIDPAIREARREGIDAHGPIPADTIFVRALAGEYDGVVCMYHDQVNIARKLQRMDKRVTLFMGLPVACGTTAHGTAFDKAGQGIADPGGLAAALRYTVMLSLGGGARQ